jgi:GntR family transcriptional regulator, N-acetylglucosamine utilization regulator
MAQPGNTLLAARRGALTAVGKGCSICAVMVDTNDPIQPNSQQAAVSSSLGPSEGATEGETFGRVSVPLPRYVQIAESFLRRIEAGELKAGERLPPERELGKTLGVTRSTIREAFDILEDRGLLVRQQGQGTFISTPKIERQAAKLVPFTRGMEKRGFKTQNRMVALKNVAAEASVADGLGINVGDPVFFIHRVRLINSEPVLMERLFVPGARFEHLDAFDFSARSLYEVMDTEYGVQVSRARQSLEPVAASAAEAGLLEIPAGAPLMLERRLAYDNDGYAVEYARDLFRGDRFRFVTEVAPLEV